MPFLLVSFVEYIVGYHHIVPVRVEEFMFGIPFKASVAYISSIIMPTGYGATFSHPTMCFEECFPIYTYAAFNLRSIMIFRYWLLRHPSRALRGVPAHYGDILPSRHHW